MSLTLELEPEVETSLQTYAAAEGITPDAFIARLLASYQPPHNTTEPVWKTRLRAAQERTEQARIASGLSEEEIAADIDAEIKAYRAERATLEQQP